MKFKFYLIVAVVLLAAACGNTTAKNGQPEEKQPIPEDAVKMKYNRHLYFKVMLRDSIPAGLRQGDRIEAINGIKASDSDKSAIEPRPDKLTLSVERKGTTIEIVVDKE